MTIRCYLFTDRKGREYLQWYHEREGGDVVSLLVLDLTKGVMETVTDDCYGPPSYLNNLESAGYVVRLG